MKSLVQWSIRNTPAMNTLMIAILLVGAVGLGLMRREVFPEFDLEIILVTVPYPGASPEEAEEGICQKIEESVRGIDGIKKVSSVAREGMGTIILELKAEATDPQKILNEIRSEVDRIPSFPELADDPQVTQITLRSPAIRLGVLGPEDVAVGSELALREVTERIRDKLLQLPSVSQANVVGGKDYQIDIEIPERTLRRYGLTLKEVARLVRRQNVELPGGKLKTDSQQVLLRGKNKQLIGEGIAKIPLVTQSGGVVLTVGDLGEVRDEFIDTETVNRLNGRRGLVISIDKAAGEDLLKIVEEVKQFIADDSKTDLPPGYDLVTWNDTSEHVRDRMELLGRNGLSGLILVFIVLAIFLEKRLAFWVALGIPISIMGGCGILLGLGHTLNMLTMFAFLMALGILVDDAIVVGENVYAHRQRGKGPVQAAIDGTYEVMPSVAASVTTTIIAFTPLLLVPGIMGKFIAVMPVAVIAMLIISLVESMFILPCHLAHDGKGGTRPRKRHPRLAAGWLIAWSLPAVGLGLVWHLNLLPIRLAAVREAVPSELVFLATAAMLSIALLPYLWYPLKRLGSAVDSVNGKSAHVLQFVIRRWYLPFQHWSLNHPAIVVSVAATTLLFSFGLIFAGVAPFNSFPKLDGNLIVASLSYRDGTPTAVTLRATEQLADAIETINRRYAKKHGHELVVLTQMAVGDVDVTGAVQPGRRAGGSHTGTVAVELIGPDARDVTSQDVIEQWREEAGSFPGTESLVFDTAAMGPGGTAIEFKLLAEPRDMAKLEEAVEKTKKKLEEFRGVRDIADNSYPGKWEFQLTVKDKARAMGITLGELAETVRASYYGEEVMRLQRGRHEVKLMVRYPEEERRSLANFESIRVRVDPPLMQLVQQAVRQNSGTDGTANLPGDDALFNERPLTELADVKVRRGYSEISRLDQLRAITITADVDEKTANAASIIKTLKKGFMPALLKEYPDLKVRWEGQQEQTDESVAGLIVGLLIALVAMFAMLTLEFRSYIQPVLILLIIPFGAIGAVAGHVLLQLPVTLFSLFGLVALTGVVVNDSIVLVDFINHRVREGIPIKKALLDAGRRRFRPVLLTSLTTIVGLLPILMERSFQAQVLIPMATSLCFGLMFSTALVLVLVPVFYLVYYRLAGVQMAESDLSIPAETPIPAALPAPVQAVLTDETARAEPEDGNGREAPVDWPSGEQQAF